MNEDKLNMLTAMCTLIKLCYNTWFVKLNEHDFMVWLLMHV